MKNSFSDVRVAWAAELAECARRRKSLHRRAQKAKRSGDYQKALELSKQSLVEPLKHGWPDASLVAVKANEDDFVWGWVAKDEWDKTMPTCLRTDEGRFAWQAVLNWRAASKEERHVLEANLRKARGNAFLAMWAIFKKFERGNSNFFREIAVAIEQAKLNSFQGIKERLILYRFSLNFSSTPGQARHTVPEIKAIVAPNSAITLPVFRNLVREFKVPHLPTKRGKGSPNYRAI
jgi:hypothetical protein